MKKIALFFLMLISCASNLLRAQTFSLINDREPVASLDGLWRFHLGDNPAWANPNFDDSQWALLRSDEDWGKQGYKGYSGFAWYRFQVVVPPAERDLSLVLPPILTSYQVFVDGKVVKTVGRMPPNGTGTITFPTIVPLPIGASRGPRSITIALRVWHWPGWSNYHGGGPQGGGGLVGQSFLLQRLGEFSHNSRLLASGGDYTLALVEGIAGLLGLLLFLIRRTEREYLWFAGNALSNAANFAFFIYCRMVPVTIFARDWVNNFLILASALFFIAFLVTLLRACRTVLLYLAVAASLAMFLTYFLLQFGLFYVGWMNLANAFLYVVILVWAADLLIKKSRAGAPDARLLLAPVLFALTLNPIETAIYAGYQLGWHKAVANSSINLFTRPFTFTMDDATEILFLLAMLAILINRFARTRREEQRLASELEAARGMQSLLVPATPPVTPGFTVESVYIPASEVGGDFFQILPDEDGSLLIVVGDVSGKGLKAAMTVSTIIGALRGCVIREPAEVLANLNRVLHGQITGFATCVAAWITAGGTMTIANAGHIPPYRNGEELAVPGGLPLGIVEAGKYEETQFEIAAGNRLTFVSDGVVEATNEKKELFGFARTQAISLQPAQAIAEAAKIFGQEDDISVLSVTRT
ncbi:MAG TPA: SpoIIE family protein phosphatase [Acidobacteriaceae bacterium]|nr:SpoIIE family protein phosphatase [Acidobacteriaceae bacterium]